MEKDNPTYAGLIGDLQGLPQKPIKSSSPKTGTSVGLIVLAFICASIIMGAAGYLIGKNYLDAEEIKAEFSGVKKSRANFKQRLNAFTDWVLRWAREIPTSFVARNLVDVWRDLEASLGPFGDGRPPIPKKLRSAIIARDEMTCRYCQRQGDSRRGPDKRSWHLDHRVPYSLGGATDETNLVLACSTCNLKKHDSEEEAFLKRLMV